MSFRASSFALVGFGIAASMCVPIHPRSPSPASALSAASAATTFELKSVVISARQASLLHSTAFGASDGRVWLASADPDAKSLELIAYGSRGVELSRTRVPDEDIDVAAPSLSATSAALAVYGWSERAQAGYVKWFGYDGAPREHWRYPGNVGVLAVRGHGDGSVTLLMQLWGSATLHGQVVNGPSVRAQNAEPLRVLLRLTQEGKLRWLHPLPSHGRAEPMLWGAGDGRVALGWSEGSAQPLDGGVELWAAEGAPTWRAPVHSVQTAGFAPDGSFHWFGGAKPAVQRGELVHSAEPPDAPQVLGKLAAGVTSPPIEACERCLERVQLAPLSRGRVVLLGAFGAASRVFDQPVKPERGNAEDWVLFTLDGGHVVRAARLLTTQARLLAGKNGEVAVLALGVRDSTVVDGRAVAKQGEECLLRFSIDG